jgi:Fuc2NAc and GlcNAc transferase
LIYVGLFLLSVLLTFLIKEYAIKKSIYDVPNERSSHTIPTPRGGGVAIVVVFYLSLILFKDKIDFGLFLALLTAIPIVVISIIDDLFTISSKIRLVVQALSALLGLYFLGGVESIDFVFFNLSGAFVNVIAFVTILWLTNLYNFLDGIDGYAGSEAVTVGLGMFIFFSNPLGLVIAVASLGFLVFNWHKATIFMGDVGSATLGYLFAIFAFSNTSDGNIYIWLILLSLFWYDATITLFRRYRNGESITQAHKKHAYQRLTQAGWSHSLVVRWAIGFNLISILLLLWIESYILFFILLVILYAIIYLIDRKRAFDVTT